MNEPPFTLMVDTHLPSAGREEIVCHRVLRALGRTRMVYDATCEGRRIVLKVFSKFGKARRHAMREWRGLEQLQARKINSPEPLFYGRSPEGWVVATAWLDDATAAGELWKATDTTERKVQILGLIARELAHHHDRGVIQTDMHLGNFMIRGREVFALDPAMMRFLDGEVDRRQSLRQVARLTAILPESAAPEIDLVFREYAEARSWTLTARDMERLRKHHRRSRRRSVERGLRKFLRANRRHQEIRCGPWRGMADRKFAMAANLDDVTTRLDEIMAQGRILKDGKTSFVSRVTLGGVEVVIKRYNHKGLLHAIRHTIKGSRARRSWLNANRLALLGIPTPRPLAYIEERRGVLLCCSYFLAEFIDAQGLHTILADQNVPGDLKRQLIDQVVHLIDRLSRQGISHGDTKHTNILYDGANVVLTDLDAMRITRMAWLRRRRRQQDLDRCLRDLAGVRMQS